MEKAIERAVANLGILVALVPTLHYAMEMLHVTRHDRAGALDAALSGWALHWLVGAGLVLGPGMLQQLAMACAPARWTRGRRRLAAVLTTVIFPLFGLVTGYGAAVWTDRTGAFLGLALLAYALVMRV
jgi:nitrate reductase NapE component